MKKTLSILILLIFILSFSSCIKKTQNENQEGIIMRASITIWSGRTYLFELKETKELLVTKGMGYYLPEKETFDKQFAEPSPLHEVLGRETIALSEKDFDEIKSILERMDPLGDNLDIEAEDFWECAISYAGKFTVFSYGLAEYPDCDTLMKKLISLSPIEVVDSEGYKATPYNELT